MRNRLPILAIVAVVAVAGLLASVSTALAAADRTSGTRLSLVAYSTPREAYGALTSLFGKTTAGKDVDFSQSYGASGEQTRAVKAGLKADIVALSLAPDMDELVKAGLVDARWSARATAAWSRTRSSSSPSATGNPKRSTAGTTCVKPGVEVDHAEPVHLGRRALEHHGRLRRAAEAGQDRRRRRRPTCQAVQERRRRRTRARASRCRRSSSGKGDVLLAYENEAIFAQAKGQDLHYVIPRSTILIENPIAVTRTSEHGAANAFVRYLRTPDGADGSSPRTATGRSNKAVAAEFTRSSRRRPGLFTIEARPRRLAEGRRSASSTRQTGSWSTIEQQVGGATG